MKYMTPILVKETIEVQDRSATGLALRTMRKRIPLSLREVARRLAITPAYLCDLERGNRAWTADLCKRFQEALRKP